MLTASTCVTDVVLGTTLAAAMGCVAAVLLRRASAALRNTVWRVALAAFWVAPVVIMIGDALHARSYTITVPVPEIASQLLALPPQVGEASSSAASTAQGPAASPAALAADSDPARSMPSLLTVVLVVWGVGAATGSVLLVKNLLFLRGLASGCMILPDCPLRERLLHWCSHLGLRRPPRAARCGRVSVPSVVAALPPVLLLPEGMELGGGAPGLDPVIVHELAHILRGDLGVQLIARLTRVLWWWHPLAWVVARGLATSTEEACDDWAIAATGDRRGYAELLVTWATAAVVPGMSVCGWRGRNLVGRVKRVLTGAGGSALRPTGYARLALVLCVVAAAAALACTRARPVPAAQARSAGEGSGASNASRAVPGSEAASWAQVQAALDATINSRAYQLTSAPQDDAELARVARLYRDSVDFLRSFTPAQVERMGRNGGLAFEELTTTQQRILIGSNTRSARSLPAGHGASPLVDHPEGSRIRLLPGRSLGYAWEGRGPGSGSMSSGGDPEWFAELYDWSLRRDRWAVEFLDALNSRQLTALRVDGKLPFKALTRRQRATLRRFVADDRNTRFLRDYPPSAMSGVSWIELKPVDGDTSRLRFDWRWELGKNCILGCQMTVGSKTSALIKQSMAAMTLGESAS